jgi:hypothetical protein
LTLSPKTLSLTPKWQDRRGGASYKPLRFYYLGVQPGWNPCSLCSPFRIFFHGIRVAESNPMMDFALSILALIAGGFAVELFTGARVKPAFSDDRGFQLANRRPGHIGKPASGKAN